MKTGHKLLGALISLLFFATATHAAEPGAAAGPTDPQIAAIVVAANSVNIDA